MTTPISFVQNATYRFTPNESRVPIFLWTVFLGLNKVHATWRWYRRFNLYTQQQSMTQLFAGEVVHNAIQESSLLRITAQALLIATRILECVQAQRELYEAYEAWKNAITGKYNTSTPISWHTTSSGIFSPSTILWKEQALLSLKERVQRIALTTLALGWCMFALSMKIMDTIDAINWSHEARRTAVVECFVNIGKWVEVAQNHKEELLDGLEKNKSLVEYILTPTTITYPQLHDGVSKALTGTKHAHQGVGLVLIIHNFVKKYFV